MTRTGLHAALKKLRLAIDQAKYVHNRKAGSLGKLGTAARWDMRQGGLDVRLPEQLGVF
jgi:hypothetical protein